MKKASSKDVWMKFRATPEDRKRIYARAGGARSFSDYARRVLRDGGESQAVQLLGAMQADIAKIAREVLDRAGPIDAIIIIAGLSAIYEQARQFSRET